MWYVTYASSHGGTKPSLCAYTTSTVNRIRVTHRPHCILRLFFLSSYPHTDSAGHRHAGNPTQCKRRDIFEILSPLITRNPAYRELYENRIQPISVHTYIPCYECHYNADNRISRTTSRAHDGFLRAISCSSRPLANVLSFAPHNFSKHAHVPIFSTRY